MRGEVGKETPPKEMDFYDVAHDTLGVLLFVQKFGLTNQDSIKVLKLLRQRIKTFKKTPVSQSNVPRNCIMHKL